MSTQVRTKIGAFVWHDHQSSDPDRARKFYADLFGWQIEVWKPGEMDYPMINASGQMHGGFGPAQGGAPSHWLGHVLVEDVDSAAARATAAGGTELAAPMDIPEIGRMAVVQDPQGAVVSLFSSAGDPPASEGVFIWDELHTSDVEGAKQFYTEVVGWTTGDMDMGGEFTYTLFRSGDQDRAGCMALQPGMEAPPHWLTYVGADDVDATTAKAQELGATLHAGPMDIPNVGRFSVLADPTGAAFGVFKGTQQTGS